MEDLYGKTGANKSLTPLDISKTHRSNFTSSGRVTPVETNAKSQRQQAFPQNSIPGRLTPIDTSTKSTRQPQFPQNGLLNVSSHNSSKLSSSNSGSNQTKTTIDLSHHELNSTQISPISATRRPLVDTSTTSHHNGGLNLTRNENPSKKTANVSNFMLLTTEAGVKEMIQSLGLLCLVSLLLALGSLVFLLRIIPGNPLPQRTPMDNFLTEEESRAVYQVTVAMCALTLSLNLSCLLVCAIQFLFAAKLVKSSQGRLRTTKYLKKASITRVCAIGGFFLSIPLFLIGIVLFTFLHFNETPAIVTSVVIGLGIVFCGGAVIHNVFIWQREKTVLRKGSTSILNGTGKDAYKRTSLGQSHIVLPHATLDLSNGFNGTITAKSLELSTLV
eukprot:TRINITY_DN7591_c0_g1_i1.p1 TRINITY_DN7591_c0_g1~~TRINITY_DN7591_c0_g1_i1.p1  ORF type:complete len:387 (+),score=18.89 TRINITY_DN7591_c0_g1_i1:220-1380(+)